MDYLAMKLKTQYTGEYKILRNILLFYSLETKIFYTVEVELTKLMCACTNAIGWLNHSEPFAGSLHPFMSRIQFFHGKLMCNDICAT